MTDKSKHMEISFETFVKRPVKVRALRLTQQIIDSLRAETNALPNGSVSVFGARGFAYKDYIKIVTLEGMMEAHPDDWIIIGTEGEWYPCKNSIFQTIYDKA